MPGSQVLTSFDDLLDVLRGLTGQIVEASVFLPANNGGFPVASFSGVVDGLVDRSRGRRLLTWRRLNEGSEPFEPSVTLWPDRFERAELSFTGEEWELPEDPPIAEEGQGHNAFIKIYAAGEIIDLIVYI